jgi:glycosylphosphatidylinositol transamidase (GPIT) subunit GPI8
VFFFWSGHGGSSEGPLWGNEDARSYFGTERINDIVTQMNAEGMYRRMMFSIETCFSGKWGEALTGLPNVIVLTAANPNETSKADVHNSDLGVYLSNAFARTFRQYVNQNNQISLRDLYIELAKTTNGSHVSIYNERNYGSVYTNNMTDYFPQ